VSSPEGARRRAGTERLQSMPGLCMHRARPAGVGGFQGMPWLARCHRSHRLTLQCSLHGAAVERGLVLLSWGGVPCRARLPRLQAPSSARAGHRARVRQGLRVAWKKVGPYNYKCRAAAPAVAGAHAAPGRCAGSVHGSGAWLDDQGAGLHVSQGS